MNLNVFGNNSRKSWLIELIWLENVSQEIVVLLVPARTLPKSSSQKIVPFSLSAHTRPEFREKGRILF